MFKNKKIFQKATACLLAVGMIGAANVVPVFAAGPYNGEGNDTSIVLEAGTLTGTSDGTTIKGTVEPIQIKATVPTVITFNIDPNKPWGDEATSENALTSPSFTFANDCNAPLTFNVADISAQENMPAIVQSDTFTDTEWADLSMNQTKSNIAYGFVLDDESEWKNVDNASAWYELASLPLGDISANSQADSHLKVKYGMAWGNVAQDTITYDITYQVDVAE